jgi:hypothetical protein
MATQWEYDTISCHTFPWINIGLLICTSAPWWQHPWTLTSMSRGHYFINVCWDQTEQMETWEDCSRFSHEKCIRKIKNSLHHKLLTLLTEAFLLTFTGQMECKYPSKSHSSWMKDKMLSQAGVVWPFKTKITLDVGSYIAI